MMANTMRRTRIVILLASLVVLTFGSLRLCHLETQRRAIKEDVIELSKIKFGLFSVDEWRLIVANILTKKVEEFEFNGEQREAMRIKISNFLIKIISDFEARFHKEKASSLIGMVQGGIVSITGAMEKVKKDVPVFTEQILDFLAKEDNRNTVQSFMLDKLAEYTDKTFSKIDYTEHDLILEHYKLGDRPATITGLKVKMNLIRQEELQYLVLIFVFLAIVFFLLLYPSPTSNYEFVLFILISLVLLRAGLILPMIEIDARIENMSFTLFGEPVDFYDQVLYYKSKSILDIVQLMIYQPKWDIKIVGLLVLTFSVLFPLSKLFSSLLYIAYSRVRKHPIIRFMVFRTGKWSMADVMVVAIFMAYIGFSGILTEQLNQLENLSASLDIVTTNKSSLQLGFYMFTSFVLLSLIVAHKLQYSNGKSTEEKVDS